jgi:hypothetical protein
MVLGIVSLSIVWIPFLGLLSLPVSLVGTPLSGVGFYKTIKGAPGRGAAIAGIATNLVALALWFSVAAAVVGIFGSAAGAL